MGLGFPTLGKNFFRLYPRQLGCEESRLVRCTVCTFMWFLGNGELVKWRRLFLLFFRVAAFPLKVLQ